MLFQAEFLLHLIGTGCTTEWAANTEQGLTFGEADQEGVESVGVMLCTDTAILVRETVDF